MKLTLLLFFVFITTSLSFAKKRAPLKMTRDQKLMLLIKKEEEAIDSVKRPSARLFYRKFELQNEKLKIISRKENIAFIKSKSSNRELFFKKTKAHYYYLKSLSQKLLKIRGNSPYLAPTFYALSQNCRDFKFEDKELYYINKALKNAKRGSLTKYNILVSKAEYLYNIKKYKPSYALYKRIVKNDEDQWYTKNLYNYAWTQFKTHRFDGGIRSLEKAYVLSRKERYVDFTEQVMNSLIVFYITHSKIQEAISFILEHDNAPIGSLFKLARKASVKGFYQGTNQVVTLLYNKILPLKKKKLKKGEKSIYLEKMVELKVFELQHYREFNKKSLFYKTVQGLEKFKLATEYKEETTQYITSEVSDLQQILKKGFNEQQKTYNKNILKLCIYYFKRLRSYDTPNKEKYFYYSAETLFSVEEYKRSIAYYKKSISKKDEFTLNRKSIDALYIAIEEAQFKKPVYYKNLEYVYSKVIALWPRQKETKKVITKLFNLYFKLKMHKRMHSTIVKYAKLFPSEQKAQKALFEKQLDLLIKQQDVIRLSQKLTKIRRGFLSFTSKRAEQVEDILSTILFNKYKALRKSGKNIAALKGYKSVYVKTELTRKIKAQAALNISIISADLFNSTNTLKWMNRTYKMDKEIYKKNINIFLTLADRTLLFHDFVGASNLYRYYLKHSCQNLKKNTLVFKKLIEANLANGYTRKSLYYFDRYKKCSLENNNQIIKSDIIAYLLDENNVSKSLTLLKTSSFTEKERFDITESLYWKNNQDSSILSELKQYKQTHAKDFFAAKLALKDLENKLPRVKKFDTQYKKEMTPEKFNTHLNLFFSRVSTFLENSKKVVDFKNKFFTLKALKLTEKTLNLVKTKIDSIKSPIKDPNFTKPFYAQMKQLAMGFNQQAQSYKQTKENFMNDYSILTERIPFTVLSRSPSAIKTIDLEQ